MEVLTLDHCLLEVLTEVGPAEVVLGEEGEVAPARIVLWMIR